MMTLAAPSMDQHWLRPGLVWAGAAHLAMALIALALSWSRPPTLMVGAVIQGQLLGADGSPAQLKPLPIKPAAPPTALLQSTSPGVNAPSAPTATAPSPQAEGSTNTSSGNAAATGATGDPQYDLSGLSNPKPGYPPISRRLGEEGQVVLRVLVNAQGSPEQVEVLRSSGHARLDNAARDTVLTWRFAPARRAGVPVAGWVQVPIDFELRR